MREVIISRSKRTVFVDGVEVEFANREFDLLYFLANNQGKVFSRKQIVAAAWEHKHVIDRVVDVAILKIRKKINDVKIKISDGSYNFTYIQTVLKSGYRLSDKLNIKIDDDLVKKNLDLVSTKNGIVINGSYQDNKMNTVVVTNIADSKFGRLVVFIGGGNCIVMGVKDFKSFYRLL